MTGEALRRQWYTLAALAMMHIRSFFNHFSSARISAGKLDGKGSTCKIVDYMTGRIKNKADEIPEGKISLPECPHWSLGRAIW